MATLKDKINSLVFGQKSERFWLSIAGEDKPDIHDMKPLSGDALSKALKDVITKGAWKLHDSVPIMDEENHGVRLFRNPTADKNGSLVGWDDKVWQNVSADDVRNAFLEVSKSQNIIIGRLPEGLQPFAREMETAGELRNDYVPSIESILGNDREYIESAKEGNDGVYPYVKDKYYELIGISTINDKYYENAGLHATTSMDNAYRRYQVVKEMVDKAEDYTGKNDKEPLENGGVFVRLADQNLNVSNVVSTLDAIVSPEEKVIYERNASVDAFADGYRAKVGSRLEYLPPDGRHNGDGKAPHDVAFDWDKGVAYVFREVSRDKFVSALESECRYLSYFDDHKGEDIDFTLADVVDGGYVGDWSQEQNGGWSPNAAAGLAASQEVDRRHAKILENSHEYRTEVGRRLGKGFSWHAEPEKKDEIKLYHNFRDGNRIDEGSIIAVSTRQEDGRPVPVIDIADDGHIKHDVPFEEVDVHMGHHDDIENFVTAVEDKRYKEFLKETKERNRNLYYVPLFTVSPGDKDYQQLSKDNYRKAKEMVNTRAGQVADKKIPSFIDDVALKGTRRGFPLTMKDKDTRLVYDDGAYAVTNSGDGKYIVFSVENEEVLKKHIRAIPNVAQDYKYLSVPDDLKHLVNKETLVYDPQRNGYEINDINNKLGKELRLYEDMARWFDPDGKAPEKISFGKPVYNMDAGLPGGLERKGTEDNPIMNYILKAGNPGAPIPATPIYYLSPDDKKKVTAAVEAKRDQVADMRMYVRQFEPLRDFLPEGKNSVDIHLKDYNDKNFLNIYHNGVNITSAKVSFYGKDRMNMELYGPKTVHDAPYGEGPVTEVSLTDLPKVDRKAIADKIKERVHEMRQDADQLLAKTLISKGLSEDKSLQLDIPFVEQSSARIPYHPEYTVIRTDYLDMLVDHGNPSTKEALQAFMDSTYLIAKNNKKPLSELNWSDRRAFTEHLGKYGLTVKEEKTDANQRTADISKLLESAGNGRWHQDTQQLKRAAELDARAIVQLSEGSNAAEFLSVREYSDGHQPSEDLVRAVYAALNKVKPIYIPVEKAEELGLRPNVETKPLTILSKDDGGFHIKNEYLLQKTNFLDDSISGTPEKHKAVQSFINEWKSQQDNFDKTVAERRAKLETLVSESRFAVPVEIARGDMEATLKEPGLSRPLSAAYSVKDNKVYVLDKGVDGNDAEERTHDIIEALVAAASDSRNGIASERNDLRLSTLMGDIYYGVDRNVALPRVEAEEKLLTVRATEKMYDDPEYAAEALYNGDRVNDVIRNYADGKEVRIEKSKDVSDGIENDAYALMTGDHHPEEDSQQEQKNSEVSNKKKDEEKQSKMSHGVWL